MDVLQKINGDSIQAGLVSIRMGIMLHGTTPTHASQDAWQTVKKAPEGNVIKLRIDSYQGIQTKCMPFLFSLDKSPKMWEAVSK